MIDVNVKLSVHSVCSLEYLVGNMNTYITVSCLLAFAVFVSADPPAALPLLHVATVGSIPNPNYRFNYAVSDPSTGDHKAQWEARNGDLVRGAYSLVEPDGNVRQVEYSADSLTGFNAIVKRTGPKIHPLTLPATAAITPVMTKPVLDPITIDHGPEWAHIEHAPLIAPAPVVEEHAPVIAPAPVVEVDHAPAYHGVDVAPLLYHQPAIDVAPFIAPIHGINLLQYQASPWLQLHGASYGSKGHIVRRWAAGPIALDGKTLTIKTKH